MWPWRRELQTHWNAPAGAIIQPSLGTDCARDGEAGGWRALGLIVCGARPRSAASLLPGSHPEKWKKTARRCDSAPRTGVQTGFGPRAHLTAPWLGVCPQRVSPRPGSGDIVSASRDGRETGPRPQGFPQRGDRESPCDRADTASLPNVVTGLGDNGPFPGQTALGVWTPLASWDTDRIPWPPAFKEAVRLTLRPATATVSCSGGKQQGLWVLWQPAAQEAAVKVASCLLFCEESQEGVGGSGLASCQLRGESPKPIHHSELPQAAPPRQGSQPNPWGGLFW